ncbi:MAG: D-alanyl-D-alanine carboxypeptidase [Eubacteriales bacterium]|nr:D-alanyl-D-alanine carboxypeptidase [Eubacteriales bacterium]
MKMKRLICLLITVTVLFMPVSGLAADETKDETAEIYPFSYAFEEFWYTKTATFGDTLPVRAALLMEADTGTILYAQDENTHYPIASVTKIMSTLLVVEAIDESRIKLDDTVIVGEAAAGMGGSQVYLEVGEQISVADMLKAMIVVSANDATVAFAEHIAGSEQSFVTMMNERAGQLGMTNTHFANCHGLTEEGHYSSALDVAIMTRELLKHDIIFNYTTIWMDTFRNGTFGLANTNKLIRFYSGANGMKTGFTDAAKYCLSGTAKRDGMQLIAVILGADTSDLRFANTKKLLDFGFANYQVYIPEKEVLGKVTVESGAKGFVEVDYTPPSILTEKGKGSALSSTVTINTVKAPVKAGDTVGVVEYFVDGTKVASAPVVACGNDKEITFLNLVGKIWKSLISFF